MGAPQRTTRSCESEAGLLAGLRAGEAAAYESLVRHHGPRLLAVARRLLRREEDAQDAVQDAFLAAFKAVAAFEGQSSLGTWLHRITVNAALMKLRAGRRRPELALEDLLPAFDELGEHVREVRDWSAQPDALLDREALRRRVRACIDRLPERYRTVLVLREVEELSTAETAALLGVSEGAVKVRAHRARQALRTLLEETLAPAPSVRRAPRPSLASRIGASL